MMTKNPDKNQLKAEFEIQLEKIYTVQDQPDVQLLIELLSAVSSSSTTSTKQRFLLLYEVVNAEPKLAYGLAQFLLVLIEQYQQIGCLTDLGVSNDKQIWDKLSAPLKHKLLPKINDNENLYDLIQTAFINPYNQNKKWLLALDDNSIAEFISCLISAHQCYSKQLSDVLPSSYKNKHKPTTEYQQDSNALIIQASAIPTHTAQDSKAQTKPSNIQLALENQTGNANKSNNDTQEPLVNIKDHNQSMTHDIATQNLAEVNQDTLAVMLADERLEEKNAAAELAKQSILQTVYQSILILSYRLSGIGLHKELIRTYPEALNYHSAFIAQNTEVTDYVKRLMQSGWHDDSNTTLNDHSKHLLVMLSQCRDIVVNIRKQIYRQGLSVSLTNKLTQIDTIIERMISLIELSNTTYELNTITDAHDNADADSIANVQNQKAEAITAIFLSLYDSTLNSGSVKHVLDDSLHLMSKKIVDNASKHGEHYISTDVTGYKNMFKKAALGGVLIAILAILKISASSYHLVPFGVAFVNSMIYGLGFVIIHLLHGTVATKQPAMTAAAIAATVEQGQHSKKFKLDSLAHLIVDIMRTQFIAILGNVMLAMPIALLICVGWSYWTDTSLVSAYKANKLLIELNPFITFAVFHAAIAGFYLFLSGIIAGYYDNQAVYHRLSARIFHHPLLIRFLSSNKRKKIGDFIEEHLGAIMGNFLFGVMLGSTATVGYFFGLPIDIRHIAFSSANFVYGVMHLDMQSVTVYLILVSLFGVILIGVVNLMVSFSLALTLALKAKRVRFGQWRELFSLVLIHFIKYPRNFFIPRAKPIKYTKLDTDGNLTID